MANEYEYGDQMESRIVLSWTPGQDRLVVRSTLTHWRGDVAVRSDVSPQTPIGDAEELAFLLGVYSEKIWKRFQQDTFNADHR